MTAPAPDARWISTFLDAQAAELDAARNTRLAYGLVSDPGVYQTTITQPLLFRDYLIEQINIGKSEAEKEAAMTLPILKLHCATNAIEKNKNLQSLPDSGGFLLFEFKLLTSNSYTGSASASHRQGAFSCFPRSRRSCPQTNTLENRPRMQGCVYRFDPGTNGRGK